MLTLANLFSWIGVGCCDPSNLLRVVLLSGFIFTVTILFGLICFTDIPEKISDYFKKGN